MLKYLYFSSSDSESEDESSKKQKKVKQALKKLEEEEKRAKLQLVGSVRKSYPVFICLSSFQHKPFFQTNSRN